MKVWQLVPEVVVVVDEPEPCIDAICARRACTCAWRSESVSAFAGLAKENAKPKTKAEATRIAATFFVANDLLIVYFDLSSRSLQSKVRDRMCTLSTRSSMRVCLLLILKLISNNRRQLIIRAHLPPADVFPSLLAPRLKRRLAAEMNVSCGNFFRDGTNSELLKCFITEARVVPYVNVNELRTGHSPSCA